MSRPIFWADHNLRQPIVDGVHRLEPSVEIILARQVGLDQSQDEEVLARAAKESWVVLTHDRKTMAPIAEELIRQNQPMKGLFVVKAGRQFRRGVIEDLILIWACSEAEAWENRIECLPF